MHLRVGLPLALAMCACAGNGAARRMIPYSDLTTQAVPAPDAVVAYGAEPLQHGELRLPGGRDRVPLVVLLHGGCWRAEYDLQHVRGAAHALKEAGFATWTPEYRRLGDTGGGWPGTFDDVAHAVDFVRVLARQHARIDTTRVVLMGHSAGGQLALWAATRRQAEITGLFVSSEAPLPTSGVVSLAGIADLAAYGSAAGSCNASVTPLLGGTVTEQPQRYRAVSPIERVPILTAVRIVHGELDPIVPLAQSRELLARNRAAGGTTELDVVPGAGHFDLIAPRSDAWPVVLHAVRALTDQTAQRVHTGQ
ncbi:MAG TPA: alpha/beta fold hydrolase [Gemmatimonadaceae bacterium]